MWARLRCWRRDQCKPKRRLPPELVVRRPGVSPPPPANLPSKRGRDLILRVWHVDENRGFPGRFEGGLLPGTGLLRPGLPRNRVASRALPGRSAAAARLRSWRWGKTRAGQSVALGSISLDSAQKLLPPKTTLLEYAFLRDGVTAFVVTRSGTKQLHWQLDLKELERQVKTELLPALSGDQSRNANLDAVLAAVSRLVIYPVVQSLLRGNGRLIVVPTGYLNYLPSLLSG